MPIANFTLPGASAPSFPEAIKSQSASGFVPPPATVPVRIVCRICAQITTEMVMLASHRIQMRRDRRRTLCHIRQIAMYVCHVALQIPLCEIAKAFGRDRTTVGHACHVVEDRRDDPAFDEFVAVVERTVVSVFRSNGVFGNE
ncbi:helix-turn-helix domain-containing protein [Rhizobium grahamii]|uniref:helix-turn-helix domain-containing protein n=1 Tax=Rhizobium grahamii TaxID=1120045 RepID=UPI000E0AD3C4|nr:helix-turn-helix domain-containing protein [Rhizobium grahamii]